MLNEDNLCVLKLNRFRVIPLYNPVVGAEHVLRPEITPLHRESKNKPKVLITCKITRPVMDDYADGERNKKVKFIQYAPAINQHHRQMANTRTMNNNTFLSGRAMNLR